MKYLVAVLLSWTGAQAGPPAPAPMPPPGLRQVLEEFHPEGGIPPRHLSPSERAELRRQLSEFGQPANPVVQRRPLESMPPPRRR